MIRSIALIGVFAALAFAAPLKVFDDLPSEFKDMFPAEVKEYLAGLTMKDMNILKEVGNNAANYANQDEVLIALRAKSPALAEKVEKLQNLLQEKINALGDEAKAFVKEAIREFHTLETADASKTKLSPEKLKAKVLVVVEMFKALSDAAKADLEKQFSVIASIFKSKSSYI